MNWWDHLTDQHNIQNRTSKKKKKKSLVNNYFRIPIYAIAVFSGEKSFSSTNLSNNEVLLRFSF